MEEETVLANEIKHLSRQLDSVIESLSSLNKKVDEIPKTESEKRKDIWDRLNAHDKRLTHLEDIVSESVEEDCAILKVRVDGIYRLWWIIVGACAATFVTAVAALCFK